MFFGNDDTSQKNDWVFDGDLVILSSFIDAGKTLRRKHTRTHHKQMIEPRNR